MRGGPVVVLDAPSVLGLRPPAPGRVPGARRLPEALRGNRLVERLQATDAGRVDPPPYSPEVDPATGVRNGATIPGYSIALADRVVEGFWVHVDTDVLDPELMPAVDTPEPGGLTQQELVALLRVLTTSELAKGMQLTVPDPDLDPDGRLAAELTDTVVAGLGPPVA